MFRFCLKVFTQTEKHMKPWKEKSHIGDFKTRKYEHFHYPLFKIIIKILILSSLVS